MRLVEVDVGKMSDYRLNVYKIRVDFLDRVANPERMKTQVFLSVRNCSESKPESNYSRVNLGKVGVLDAKRIRGLAKSPDRIIADAHINPEAGGVFELADDYTLILDPNEDGLDVSDSKIYHYDSKE